MKNLALGTSVPLEQISAAARKAEALLGDCDIVIDNYKAGNVVIQETLGGQKMMCRREGAPRIR